MGGEFRAIDAETVTANLMEPVFALDGDGFITFANDRLLDISLLSAEEVVGAEYALLERIVEDGFDDLREAVGTVSRGDSEEVHVELSMCHPEAAPVPRRLPAEVRVTSIRRDGEVRGVLLSFRSVSRRKERERELERQNERLDEFASVVSHDLRNPLNVAEGHLGLAAEECDSDHLRPVGDALERMGAIIEATLVLAREGRSVGDPERVDLRSLLEESWRHVETRYATLDVVGDVVVHADSDRLRNLFENLFRNAVEHGGDDVTVRVGALDGGGFYVEDDGPGVPPPERESVFGAGYTTDADGTGFGLAIVKRIAEANGWDVTATEGSAGGARFEFTGVDASVE